MTKLKKSSRESLGQLTSKLGTKQSWVKGIQIGSNEGPQPFPRGDNYEIVEYIDEIKKSSSQEPLGQCQQNLAQSIRGEGDSSLLQ